MHVEKAHIVAILRSRELHGRASWVDRTLPSIVDTERNSSLLAMLEIDLATLIPEKVFD